MRKLPLFALGMCAAALLGQVSLALADQAQSPEAQTSGQQNATRSSQHADRPPFAQKPQATSPSQKAGKQASGIKVPAATPSPQTGKQPSTGKVQAAPPSPETGKTTANQKAQAEQNSPQPKQASGLKAQAARPPAIPPGYRLLSLKEGRTIVQEMSWADDEEGLSPDCSHLVHKLYEQAGHPYPYASSLDLYRGSGPFLRVRYAHPGDLVVWRGHVGIVVNPREHSFFSTTSSGARTENYRSAYWRGRGYPHFFRYLTKSPLKDGLSEASNRPPAS